MVVILSHPTRASRRAFTLVELLVVVAILALLVSLLMPSLSGARESGRRAVCATNLHGIGQAWHMYFGNYNDTFPLLSYAGSDRDSQYNFLIHFTSTNWVNAGLLYVTKYLPGPQIYICPTVDGNTPGPWFSDTGGGFVGTSPTPWLPTAGSNSRMTYGTRRMIRYTDQNILSDFNLWGKYQMRLNKPLQVAGSAGQFSLMADCFSYRSWALMSHVPGVNVLYLDGHVRYFQDPDRTILYDNGIGETWGAANNWTHDNIWMTLDQK